MRLFKMNLKWPKCLNFTFRPILNELNVTFKNMTESKKISNESYKTYLQKSYNIVKKTPELKIIAFGK